MTSDNNTSTEQTATQSAKSTTGSSIGLKELLIPISIVIAGALVGLGLYFGGEPENETDDEQTGNNPLQALVQEAGLSVSEVEECINTGEVAAEVQSDVENAIETGGSGTPWSIVIGPDGKTYPLNGAVPTAAIEQVLDLARAGADAPPTERPTNTDLVSPVTADDHIKGSLDAPIKIVEYSDFDCTFCARFHDSMNQIVAQNDDVAWVYRHFPLDQIHPNARTIALISECVADLGGNEAFWTFADGYFAL